MDPAVALHQQPRSVAVRRSARRPRDLGQHHRAIDEQVLVTGRAGAAQERPPVLPQNKLMGVIPGAADASPGEGSHGHITVDVDTHGREPPTAAKSPHREYLAGRDQCHALGRDVVSHPGTVDPVDVSLLGPTRPRSKATPAGCTQRKRWRCPARETSFEADPATQGSSPGWSARLASAVPQGIRLRQSRSAVITEWSLPP